MVLFVRHFRVWVRVMVRVWVRIRDRMLVNRTSKTIAVRITCVRTRMNSNCHF